MKEKKMTSMFFVHMIMEAVAWGLFLFYALDFIIILLAITKETDLDYANILIQSAESSSVVVAIGLSTAVLSSINRNHKGKAEL